MGVTDSVKTSSIFSRVALAARVLTDGIHLRDMFNGYAFPTLSNGVQTKIHTVPDRDYSVLRVMVSCGAQNDPAHKSGVAHLLEHMVFSQNEETRREIELALLSRGAQFTATTNAGWTQYEVRILDEADNLDYAARLMSRVIFSPAIDAAELEHEKAVVRDEIRTMAMRDDCNLMLKATEAAYGCSSTADAVLGSPDSLGTIDLQDMIDFHHAHYVAQRVTIEYTGPRSPLKVMDIAQKYFSNVPDRPAPALPARQPADIPLTGGGEDIKSGTDSIQTGYALALPLRNDDSTMQEQQVLAAYMNILLREAMRGQGERYAYWQQVSLSGNGMGGGVLALAGSALPAVANQVLRRFTSDLHDLRAGNVNPEIFLAAVGSARMDRAQAGAAMALSDSGLERPEIIRERTREDSAAYLKIRPERLMEIARKNLDFGSPGLCLRGCTEGVMRLADIQPLLPGGAAPAALSSAPGIGKTIA